MKKNYVLLIIILTTYLSFGQAANDTCITAEAITVTTNRETVNFDISTATVDNEIGCSGTTPDDFGDIWYDFTMPIVGNLFIDGAISWNNFALYDACGGNEIICGSTNLLIEGLTSGSSYKLRLFRTDDLITNSRYASFTIQAFEAAINDTCVTAESIPVSTSSTTIGFEVAGAAIANEMGCSGTTPDDYGDIWYDVTMPVSGNLLIDGAIAWNNFALYDACEGAEIICGSSKIIAQGLTSGTTYKLRVFRTKNLVTNSRYKTFTIQAFEAATNDTCVTAENIPVSTSSSTVDFEVAGSAIVNEIGCSGATPEDYGDIWYDFTMPVNGNLFVDGAIAWNNFALYDACAGIEIICGTTNILAVGLTSGTTYKLRIYRTKDLIGNSRYKSFSIQAFEHVTNDTCATAENVTVSTSSPTSIDFEIGGAELKNEFGCSETTPNDYGDIWYNFTMPANGNLFIDASIAWNNFAIYDACDGTEVACASGDLLAEGLISDTAYKLRVFRNQSLMTNSRYKSFSMQATAVAINDTCDDAETIIVSETESTVNFQLAGAEILNEVGCPDTTAQNYTDVWYDFNMPADGNIFIDGGINYNNFQLFDACNGTSLGCINRDGIFSSLTSGTIYKLRVFRTLNQTNINTYRSFIIRTEIPLSTNKFDLEKSISIYPNPANTVLNLSSKTPIDSIQIFNMLGQSVLQTKEYKSMNISHLKSGMYLVNIKIQDRKVVKRLIVE